MTRTSLRSWPEETTQSPALSCPRLQSTWVYLFWQAYQMEYESFSKLVDLLVPIFAPIDCSLAHVNGFISNSVQSAVALQYFAGGSAYDIATTYWISFSKVLVSVWRIVNALNQNHGVNIEYPNCTVYNSLLQKGLKYFPEQVLSAALCH